MLVEFQYDLVAVRGERAVDAARAAIDAISIADFTDDDLAEAKNCALSLLGVSVSGMSDYVDALCGFIAHSGRSDILDEYRHKISNVTRTEVATVLEELYQSADYIIEVSEEW
ncbi:hypothetical protein [Nocardia fluminea]|uniref:hypothetical protein n=1 Tax=Nocardia fluminea TaxID=134984 RepID=UPI003404D947